MFYYAGASICRRYMSQKKISRQEVIDLCRNFDLDSLSIVDVNGLVVVSTAWPAGYKIADDPVVSQFNSLLWIIK